MIGQIKSSFEIVERVSWRNAIGYRILRIDKNISKIKFTLAIFRVWLQLKNKQKHNLLGRGKNNFHSKTAEQRTNGP